MDIESIEPSTAPMTMYQFLCSTEGQEKGEDGKPTAVAIRALMALAASRTDVSEQELSELTIGEFTLLFSKVTRGIAQAGTDPLDKIWRSDDDK